MTIYLLLQISLELNGFWKLELVVKEAPAEKSNSLLRDYKHDVLEFLQGKAEQVTVCLKINAQLTCPKLNCSGLQCWWWLLMMISSV